MNQGAVLEPVLEMIGISKHFTGVQALKNVDIKLFPGEIHSIIGQNGAGKSTLMKILCGIYRPDAGKILLHGKEISITNTAEAKKLGIGIVYQELSLLNNLKVFENVFLGRELTNFIHLDNKKMKTEAEKCLAAMGITNIDVDQKVELFSLAKRQLIEIAKEIYLNPSILILDEPTAALTKNDTAKLFEMLFKLKSQGMAIVFISHRLEEIKKYCDRGTILMNGSVTAGVLINDVREEQIIASMLGETYKTFDRGKKETRENKRPVLTTEGVCKKDILKDVTVEVYPGEITGFTGLLGAGQDILWRIIYGAEKLDSGKIYIRGREKKITGPDGAVELGIGLLTENRKEEGIYSHLSVMDNIAIPSLKKYNTAGFFPLLRIKKVKKDSLRTAGSLNIVMRNIQTPVKYLSGGNQQKVILGRWLLKDLDILIFIEPTRGVDVGAKTEIYKILEDLSRRGKAVIVISTDTTEILKISDRIFVMRDGTVKKILNDLPKEEELQKLVQGA
jgi:ribose transport system ATP-binding protein